MTNDKLKKIPVPDELKNSLHSVKYVFENTNYKSLLEEILKQMGFDSSEDYYTIDSCIRSGAGGGINGFIYHRECDSFVENNFSEIRLYIIEFCEETGSLGEEYQNEAVEFIFEANEITDKNEEEWEVFIEDIDIRTAGMCYGFLKWSPYFRNSDKDIDDFMALYNFFTEDKLETEGTTIGTFLAWFVLEGVCREFEKDE